MGLSMLVLWAKIISIETPRMTAASWGVIWLWSEYLFLPKTWPSRETTFFSVQNIEGTLVCGKKQNIEQIIATETNALNINVWTSKIRVFNLKYRVAQLPQR